MLVALEPKCKELVFQLHDNGIVNPDTLIGQAKLSLDDPNVRLGKRLGIAIDTGGVLEVSLRHVPMGDEPSAFVLGVAAKQSEELVFTIKPFHTLCWEFQVQEKNAEINFTAWHCHEAADKKSQYTETELAWCMRPHSAPSFHADTIVRGFWSSNQPSGDVKIKLVFDNAHSRLFSKSVHTPPCSSKC
jgi:hypothetical protein